jgi:hypothetical protein
MQTSPESKTSLPFEVSKQLPVFQILNNQLPDKMKTPEAKKTISKVVFWALFALLGYFFFKALPTLIEFAKMSVLLTVYSIVAVVLILLFPKIVNTLSTLGRILIFKSDKAIAEKFSIETLQLLLQDVKKTREAVRQRITKVEGVRVNMISEAEAQNQESATKASQIVKLTAKAKKCDTDAIAAKADGNDEQARQLTRDANEARVAATMRDSERTTSLELAKSYSQYSNQFGKALEVLKDNESAAKIYDNLLTSSITIIAKKLDATTKMREATEGLADIFEVEDKWKFQVAMEAVKVKIGDNIANIQRNLEFLSESRLNNIEATKSQDELESIVSQLSSGEIKKLDVQEVASPYHNLTPDERPDKTFSLD